MSEIFRSDLLEGTSALITGGGTGIGYGIAEALAKCGADIAIASRKPEHLEPAAEKLGRHGTKVVTVPVNVRERDAAISMVKDATERLGRIDMLVNNAAGNFYAPSAELTERGWKAVVETDLYGTFFCSQAVYPVMVEQGGGCIVSISMTLHYRGWPRMAHATAAKAGVDALTRTLAIEWAADKIRVNAVAPGPIPTEGVRRAFGEGGVAVDEKMKRFIPLQRWGSPDDIGNMVVFLGSPAGEWITGQIFVIDGGSSLSKV
jgi:NAD(P)-dependent dehydrogenase (short-subunit alcohol dehydrogenase family)